MRGYAGLAKKTPYILDTACSYKRKRGNFLLYSKKIENGTATFNVPYPTSFAVIETSSDGTGSSLTPSDSSPIRTGAVVCTTSFVILVLSGAVLFILKRRNKFD